jgi:hypothetical protein
LSGKQNDVLQIVQEETFMPEEHTGASTPLMSPTPNTDQGQPNNPKASLSDLKDKVQEDLSAATDAVKDTANTALDKVSETVAEQTNFAARQVGGIATALQKVGAELEDGDQREVGRYAKQIGDSVQTIAKNIEGRDLGEIAGMAEDFGRKQPLAFLGVAALAGLAASRFLTASAKRTSAASAGKAPETANASGSQTGSFAAGGSNNG